jgi:tetratricopeptide (TPR) repeat protein
MPELDEESAEEIRRLCSRGNDLAEEGRFAEALESYWAAWDHLPEPQTEWEAATWILAAIGDANFQQGNYEAGRDNLTMAMHCPAAIGNPFLHLRLGQCQFELGNFERAADELARAFLLGGSKLFDKDDPKYLTFIRSRLKAPPDVSPDGR